MAVTVASYGVRAHWQRSMPGPVSDQMWLAHRLREDLVETHRDYEAALAAIWSAHPEIAGLETTISELDDEVTELAEAAAKERSANRTRRTDTPTTRRLSDARRERKQAKTDRRTEIGAVYEAMAGPISETSEAERAAVKDLYTLYCQVGVDVARAGEPPRVATLYWAAFNDVTQHHRVAVARVKAARKQGRPAQLRHHRYQGGSSLAVQLQRQAGDPARTPELLASGGGKWRNVLQVDRRGPGAGRDGTAGHARMRLGAEQVTIPIRVHRNLPPDADVTGARLVTRRVAGHARATVQLTAKVADPVPRSTVGRPVIAVHLGWRHTGDGEVRVATWRSTMPIRVPARLAGVVTTSTGQLGEIVLPGRWRTRMRRVEELRSRRDLALDVLRAQLVAHLVDHPPAGGDDVWPAASDVARWKSPARFAHLARRVRGDLAPERAEIVSELERWRRTDRRQWETEAHTRDKLVANRDDLYAQVVAWLVRTAGELVVDDTVVAEVAVRSQPGMDAQPTALEAAAASQRTDAAPGELRARLLSTAAREGVVVHKVPHTGITRTHYRCGHLNPADADYTHRVVSCQGCGQGYDQDASATLMVLAASGHMPSPGSGGARDTG